MLDVGMPTLIELQTIGACAALCRELGLRFIELNMNLPEYQPEQCELPILIRVAEEYGVYYTLHLDENLNVSDFNARVAAAYRKTVEESIALAKKLKAPILTMHPARGVYFTLPERKVYLFEQYREQYLRSIVAFREDCERWIGDADIHICMENCGDFLSFQREALNLLLESPVFGLTFDVGHAYNNDAEAVIRAHRERLYHMHLHDATQYGNHLVLGTGKVDLKEKLKLAGEQGCRVVLETKTEEGLRRSVAWLGANLGLKEIR